jgi:glycosidase
MPHFPRYTISVLALGLILLTPLFSIAQPTTYWWNDAVFYEIFVRSFYDSNGDGIGDLKGLTKKLDYLNDGDPATTSDLGVTGIWLMPITKSPSYHGYDVTDYRAIDPDYGTMDDFRGLLEAAHSRGIKVIMDLVLNHSSSYHPWFVSSASSKTSPYRDWYIWKDQNPGYTGSWGQTVWHSRNGAYYFGMFWSGMPDLNLANADLKNEMFEVAKFWIDSVKVDGFRLDAIKHLFEAGPVMEDVPATFQFLKELRQFYKSVNPEAMTVGEVWSATSSIKKYSDGTTLDFCFEFPAASSTINSVNLAQPNEIRNQMQTVISSYPYLQYAPFLTNHDMNRVFEQLGQDVAKMKLAAAVYLTLPGVPFLYYGEEVGMIGSGRDENKRKPMQWSSGTNAGFSTHAPWYSLNSNYADFNVTKMQGDERSLWQWYRTLSSVRNQYEALRRGDYSLMTASSPGLYALARRTDDEVIIVIHNFQNLVISNPTLTLADSKLAGEVRVVRDLLAQNDIGTVLIESDGGFTSWQANVTVAARGTMLLRIGGTPSAVEATPENLPVQYVLKQNYPNPFNPETVIAFELPRREHVVLKVYDLLGKEVGTLVDEMKGEGRHQVTFDASKLASGNYFYNLTVGAFSRTRRMVLVK